MKVAFITHFCPHYRVKTFEILARYYNTDYYFFSTGDEWYWQRQHGVRAGDFRYQYLSGFRVGRTHITPALPSKLWRGNYDIYIKCINGRFALPVTYIISRLKRKPFVLWTGIWTRVRTRAHQVLFPLTQNIYRHADAIVAYGEHVKSYLIREGVLAERIFVAPHAVDNETCNTDVSEEEKATLRRKLGITPEQKVVLYLGRLEEVKGLPYLLDAFALLRPNDAILVLAGDGSDRPALTQMVQKKKLEDRVCFAGYVPPEETTRYYAIAWIYVLPSITTPACKELWGLVVNEAFNQRVPVITTEAVGAAAGGLVQDGVNGFVVPQRDSNALSIGLHRILDNPDLREELGHNAKQTITDWNNERMVLGFRQAVEYVRRN